MCLGRGGGGGLTPGCIPVCGWRRLLASHRLPLPFPWTVSLRRRQRPSASHHLVPSLSPPGLSLPPYSLFLPLQRLCQRSPRTVPVSLLCVESMRRRATAPAVGRGGGGGNRPNNPNQSTRVRGKCPFILKGPEPQGDFSGATHGPHTSVEVLLPGTVGPPPPPTETHKGASGMTCST